MAAANEQGPNVHPAGVQEALRRQIGDAARVLRAPELTDDAIHHARKELKRARSNLRLLRPAIGGNAFGAENAALRDASRPLGEARDAKVIVETIDRLLDEDTNAARRALLEKARGVLEQKRIAARDALAASGALTRSAEQLDEAWQRVNDWQLSDRQRRVIERGVRRVYKRAQKALAHADTERSAEALHEWRKHVKYLGAAMVTLDDGRDRVPQKLLKRLDTLADRLGADHDLVVLQDELAKLHSRASGARTGVFSLIAQRRQALQAKALKDARSVFGRKPKAFVKYVRKSGALS